MHPQTPRKLQAASVAVACKIINPQMIRAARTNPKHMEASCAFMKASRADMKDNRALHPANSPAETRGRHHKLTTRHDNGQKFRGNRRQPT
jgi:hypothetical protein